MPLPGSITAFSGGPALVRKGIGVLFIYQATPTAMHKPRMRPMNIPSSVLPLLFFFVAALGLYSLAIYIFSGALTPSSARPFCSTWRTARIRASQAGRRQGHDVRAALQRLG